MIKLNIRLALTVLSIASDISFIKIACSVGNEISVQILIHPIIALCSLALN